MIRPMNSTAPVSSSRIRNTKGLSTWNGMGLDGSSSDESSDKKSIASGAQVFGVAGEAPPQGVRLGGLCEEGLEVVLDQRIERRQGGTAPAVDGPTVWCGGPKRRP